MTSAARTLLGHAIDYAGMYWPSRLDLDAAVANFAAYLTGPDAWALGRFVLPSARAAEFAGRWPAYARDWPIAYIVGDAQPILGLSLKSTDAAELPPLPLGALPEKLQAIRSTPDAGTLFVELLPGDNLSGTLHLLSLHRLCAKLRTGGPGVEQFPSSAQIADFLAACVASHVPAKATAGLHHALRGSYRNGANAAPGEAAIASQVTMHGFINVFLAATLLATGGCTSTAITLLDETDAKAFRFDAEAAQWRDHTFTSDQLHRTRAQWLLSFGSCSFTEPLEDMRTRGWLV